MSKVFVGLLMLFATMLLMGDVAIKMKMPQTRFMLYETIIAELQLRNTSGQVLIFGNEAEFRGHLELELTDMHDRPLKNSGVKVDLRGLILRPGVDHNIRVDLTKWLDLQQTGFYRIKCYLAHPMLKNQYTSNRCNFDITNGHVLWKKDFGIPGLQGIELGEDRKMRSYIIKTLPTSSATELFLAIEDEKNIYSLKRIGKMLGRAKPECEIDDMNQLHILLQVSNRLYLYEIYDWEGNREKQRYYTKGERVPTLLRQSATGEVSVVGGVMQNPGLKFTPETLLPNNPVHEEDDLDRILRNSSKKRSARP